MVKSRAEIQKNYRERLKQKTMGIHGKEWWSCFWLNVHATALMMCGRCHGCTACVCVCVKISPGAVVCEECELVGDITIGARTVIHPKARILAEAGPIIIGENNIIEELTQIVNRNPSGSPGGSQSVMIIGSNNVFEVGSYVEATKIGDHNVVEGKAKVGRQVELTSGCIIGAMCTLTSNESLPENTIIYGSECSRRVQRERPPTQSLQIDFLAKILPNFHYIKKTKSSTPQRN